MPSPSLACGQTGAPAVVKPHRRQYHGQTAHSTTVKPPRSTAVPRSNKAPPVPLLVKPSHSHYQYWV
eukprot:376347-Rhodomonas_salina.1